MSEVIVSIQLPGGARKNNERYLRAVCEDSHVETVRRTVTAMMRKPSDYVIGNKTAKPTWAKAQKLKALKRDEEVLPGVEVDTKVEEAMAAV